MNDNWDISFVEGVLKSDINEDALPKDENTAENHGFFCIKLIHTQWRYDLTFVTPTGTSYTRIFYILMQFLWLEISYTIYSCFPGICVLGYGKTKIDLLKRSIPDKTSNCRSLLLLNKTLLLH